MMAVARRRFLSVCAVAGASVLLTGHTPYRQWEVYRRKHLLLLVHRDDPMGVELARSIATRLAANVPSSRARITRAPHLHRVASLLATDQLQFAVVTHQAAAQLLHGKPPLQAYGPIPLTTVGRVGGHLVIARADVPARHAWLLAEGLDGAAFGGEPFRISGPGEASGPDDLPAHPGAVAYATGLDSPDHAPLGRLDTHD